MSRLIVYGDIHGCYDEFIQLREKIKPNKNDTEICVGDMITKGKKSIETLRYIQEYNIQSVLGNHEDKIIRYLKHQKLNKKNPVILDNDEQYIADNLNNQDINFLNSLPIFKKFSVITVLHGGLQNYQKLDKLLSKDIKSKILRMRYLDQNHNFLRYGQENKYSTFWADIYDGNQGFIVYGHQKFKEVKNSKYTLGLDTGCVYGNKLSAAIFNNIKYFNFAIVNTICKKINQ